MYSKSQKFSRQNMVSFHLLFLSYFKEISFVFLLHFEEMLVCVNLDQLNIILFCIIVLIIPVVPSYFKWQNPVLYLYLLNIFEDENISKTGILLLQEGLVQDRCRGTSVQCNYAVLSYEKVIAILPNQLCLSTHSFFDNF